MAERERKRRERWTTGVCALVAQSRLDRERERRIMGQEETDADLNVRKEEVEFQLIQRERAAV